MVRELYQRLREYFNNLPEPTEEEKQFIRELNAGYFPITSVHRDDLEGKGFDVKKISDDDMQNLAEKMANDYYEQLFWLSMEIIAGEILGFPKVKTKDIICPKCNSENIRYDIHESRFHCDKCSQAWDCLLYTSGFGQWITKQSFLPLSQTEELNWRDCYCEEAVSYTHLRPLRKAC